MFARGMLATLIVISATTIFPITPVFAIGDAEEKHGGIVLENKFARWVINDRGQTIEFVDKATGENYIASPWPVAILRVGDRDYTPASLEVTGNRGKIEFANANARAVLEFQAAQSYFVVRLMSYEGPPPQWLSIISLRLRLSAHRNWTSGVVSDGRFACCVRVPDYRLGWSLGGGSEAAISVVAYPHRWWEGAWAAVVAAPNPAIRGALKALVASEPMIYSPVGGPFAWESGATRGSYVFASVTQSNVDQWIELCKRAGIDLIHLIGWDASQGHYEPQKNAFPDGLDGLKHTVEKIHAAGLRVGLHYLFGISPNDPYITPKPDPRLKVNVRFELASSVDEAADFIPTTTTPRDLPTVWAYMSRGNVVRIGDELIQYQALSEEPPGFAKCRRGAFGTTPRSHDAGSPVEHLYVIYGLFYPDEQSDLIEEIADRIAAVVNACKIDLVYMDGAEGMPGGWYGIGRMRAEVFRRFDHPVLVEASEWGYHSWAFHSRTGAWDHPNWGLKRFVDIHVASNRAYQELSLLPTQLGWWAILSDSRDHYAELPDELEYLCVKSLAWDMPLSFQGITVGKPANLREDEYLEMLGRYERLRLARAVPENILRQLQEEGREFRLKYLSQRDWHFVPCQWLWRRVELTEGVWGEWEAVNHWAEQPLKFRIRVLEVADTLSREQVLLTDFSDQSISPEAAPGVEVRFTSSATEDGPVPQMGELTVRNDSRPPRASWARLPLRFADAKNLSKLGALGVWVRGDGKGEVLNFQLRNPEFYWPTCAEHYVLVDYEGWKFHELHFKERDAHRHGEYEWPYSDYYAIYRNPLIRYHVDGLTLYVNNVPPGETIRCFIGPVVAFPTQKIRITELTLRVSGRSMEIPVTMESGHYLECLTQGEVVHFDAQGQLLGKLQFHEQLPVLAPGANRIEVRSKLRSDSSSERRGGKIRLEMWILTEGDPLTP